MEYTVEIILACITSLTAVSTTIINLIFGKRQKLLGDREKESIEKIKEYDALCGGMRTLLWIQLNSIYKKSLSEGFISTSELHTVETVYKSYHSLGGNSTGTAIYEKLCGMPNQKPTAHNTLTSSEESNGSFKLYN